MHSLHLNVLILRKETWVLFKNFSKRSTNTITPHLWSFIAIPKTHMSYCFKHFLIYITTERQIGSNHLYECLRFIAVLVLYDILRRYTNRLIRFIFLLLQSASEEL